MSCILQQIVIRKVVDPHGLADIGEGGGGGLFGHGAALLQVLHDTVLGKENEPCDHMYDVVGGLCENNDKFAIDRMLPKIDIGDIVYIHDTGAHGSAMGYNYNGKLRSAEVLLCEDGTHRLIRRAETPRDYFATLDFLPLMKPLFED